MKDDFEKQVITAELPTPVNAAMLIEKAPPEPDQIFVDTFDVGDKIAIIGSSKVRKTFFFLQLLLCLASGRGFLAWRIMKPRRIFHIQFEIQAHHFHRRVRNMACALGITPTDVGDRLQILNARGMGITGIDGIKRIEEIVKPYRPEVISLDPLYKIATGVENAAEDLKAILNAFDELSEATSAAIPFVHHDAKGSSGDRDIRDRGAGSNVLGRDYDACITLTPHASEPDAVVVETLLRNYRPQKPFTALWTEDRDTGGYRFELRTEIPPTKKTSKNSNKAEPALDIYLPAAVDLLKDGPMPIKTFKDTFRIKAGLTHARRDAFVSWSTSGPWPQFDTIEKKGRGLNEKMIGLRAHISTLRSAGVKEE